MAAVEVTLNGVLYPKGRSADDRPIPCTFVGSAWLTGGGPIFPEQPPISGGSPPHPEHPIWGPPGFNPPGPGMPPGIGGGPIVPPTPPEVPPDTPPSSVVKEASPGAWGYYTDANSALYAAYRPAGSGPK